MFIFNSGIYYLKHVLYVLHTLKVGNRYDQMFLRSQVCQYCEDSDFQWLKVADCPAMSFVFVTKKCQKYKSVELGDQARTVKNTK